MIRDPVKYCAALWQWDFLRPCFHGTAIRIADLDGLLDDEGVVQKHGYVERFGHHLLFETTVPDREMTEGQAISHRSLIRIGFSILYLWGTPNSFPIRKVQVWKEFADHPNDPVLWISEAGLIGWVSKWFTFVNQNPITPPPSAAFFVKPEIP